MKKRKKKTMKGKDGTANITNIETYRRFFICCQQTINSDGDFHNGGNVGSDEDVDDDDDDDDGDDDYGDDDDEDEDDDGDDGKGGAGREKH
ncbi:unnamed protein product [Enterobius vermicularis]|uniref:Uncharacterized protein n=1 Tax=Enterobius vermicularis TaxID=51028 RepID=A0A0N4VHF2_ENTVE|nr:unnamed protein product [Enterobius vermicularis]